MLFLKAIGMGQAYIAGGFDTDFSLPRYLRPSKKSKEIKGLSLLCIKNPEFEALRREEMLGSSQVGSRLNSTPAPLQELKRLPTNYTI